MFLSTKHQFSKGVINSPSPFALEVGYMIVGGGGNGGIGGTDPYVDGIISGGGGGGGGQILIGYATLQRNTTYTVTVADVGSNASRGQSSFAGVSALNGGNGGGAPPSSFNGQDVYSGPVAAAGGGGGGFQTLHTGYGSFPNVSGTPGNAFVYALGGTYGSSVDRAGGGGGAGSVRGFVSGAQSVGPGNGSGPTAGYGARPVQISLANTNFVLSAGGGGATLYQSNSRGFGGVNYIGSTGTQFGGNGGYFTTFGFPQSAAGRVNGQNAQVANSGSGGGGSAGAGATPGYGAAGKVFIFYPGTQRSTVSGASVSTNTFAGITSHTFNSNGTISFSS